jgi:phthalate 4,5-cis-dihydrodiol dehydrogenase
MSTPARVLRIGVVGLGRAFTLMLPTFLNDARVQLVAACDPLPQARAQFERDFGTPAHEDAQALCADPRVEVVYVASPHQFHAEHVRLAAAHGKHVLVEKPMAITLAQCSAMIEATQAAGVHLLVGHSHSFNTPILRTRALIESGEFGAVKMITALNYTDFLYRPRRPEELDTDAGGGVIHSQATHQMDILRLLGGGRVRSVMAHTGAWDPARPTEGAYQSLLSFDNGAFASACYSGYGHFDSDDWLGQIGEIGQPKQARDYAAARQRLTSASDAPSEARLKAARNYGGDLYQAPSSSSTQSRPAHQHFGHFIVSCEKGDLRPTPTGIDICGDQARRFEPLASPVVPRSEVIDELVAAVLHDHPPLHSGEWARATTEVCLAILTSAHSGRPVPTQWQVGLPAVKTTP